VVLNNGGKKRKQQKEKNTKIVATFVYASSQGQRTHSARTKMITSIGLQHAKMGSTFLCQYFPNHAKLAN
jgi:hypothetical protein